MAYSLKRLNGNYQERNNQIPAEQMSAMQLSDRSLELINQDLKPLENLGFELGEDGKVPERDGVPRIFIMQPGEDGIDRVQTLDEAKIKAGSREFWQMVQKGNVFAYPTDSEAPVQIQANIKQGSRPKVSFSTPLEMSEVHKGPEGHEYREPNAFTRFMNRIFSGWRKEDCEIYRQRQKLADNEEKRAKFTESEEKELRSAEKRAAEIAKKEQLKSNYKKIEKREGYKQKGKDFYKDLIAPVPKYHKEHSRTEGNADGFYSKEEFESLKPLDKKIGDYGVGGIKLSEDEYCGLVNACAHDTKFMDEGFKNDSHYDPTLVETIVNAGYSEKNAKQIIVNSYSTMISDDLMKGDLRYNQGVQLKPTINPAREMAFDILDEYKKGNKEPLAEKIAEGVKYTASVTDQYTSVPHNGAFNRFEFTAALTDLMDKDPDLKDLAMKKGLKQEDVDAVRAMREYSKLDTLRGEAKTAIAKAAYDGKELSYADKMKYAKDIINANIMESRILGENTERNIAGKQIDKDMNRMCDEAEKNKLTVTEDQASYWRNNPGTRPLPPKGQFYSDQVITVMNGRAAEYNKHPESLFDLNDPDAIKDCREITEDIVYSNHLAEMPTEELNKAMNNPGNMFQGVKLIEAADKASEKIMEKRQRQELGIDGLDLDEKGNLVNVQEEKNDELDKGFDLGHKKQHQEDPQAGGPVA